MDSDKISKLTSFDTSVRRSELDSLPFPVIITDNMGKVVFKNSFAYKMKLIKIGANFKHFLDDTGYDELLCAAKERRSAIIRCRIETGVTHAAFLPCEDGENLLYLAICSIALQKVFDFSKIDLILETYKTNSILLKSYGEMCEKYKLIRDQKAAELLKNNSLRFSRAARNMSMYIHTLTKTEDFEEQRTCELRDICTRLVSHFFRCWVSDLTFLLKICFCPHIFKKTPTSQYFLNCVP